MRWLRARFAMGLTHVFEPAFGMAVNASNWPASYGIEHPWPKFFRRIYGMLFPEAERLNLPEVLQEAARQLPHGEAKKRWLDGQEAIRLKSEGFLPNCDPK
jgi:hypothetical protein